MAGYQNGVFLYAKYRGVDPWVGPMGVVFFGGSVSETGRGQ